MTPPKPKLQNVAERAQVSLATASQVMRGTGRISEETRKKVLKAARELNYVPDGRAASMRSGERREIGLLIHQIANPFNAEVIGGVSELLEGEGYLVSILDSQDDPAREHRCIEAFIRNTRGGLLWVPAAGTPRRTVELLTTHRMPTVTFLRDAPHGNFDHVGIENAAATSLATHYLADLGHRHIAYFGGDDEGQVRRERIAGYRAALAERRLAPPVVWPCHDRKIAALDAAMALREQHPEVTAMVCNGDQVAIGACMALARMGLCAGQDVSVIGFDDIADAAIATPPLTTMSVSPARLGRKLARVLLDRIRDPDMPIASVNVRPQLVVRASTGPAPTLRQAPAATDRAKT